MNWYSAPGLWAYAGLSGFIVLYAAYLLRVAWVAHRLRTHARAVLFKLPLRLLYFGLLLIALQGPLVGQMPQTVRAVSKDIYFAVDLSASMNAADVKPSRLERVKYELTQLVRTLPTERIGLIIFSSDAFVQCPLTYDRSALLLFIETLKTNLISGRGTDFEPALRIALTKHTGSSATLTNEAKVIVLISDGENFGNSTSQVLEEIEESSVRLFTVGVGTRAGSRVPDNVSYKRQPDGSEVVSRLNEFALRQLAAEAGGVYFEISDQQNEFSKLALALAGVEGQVIDTRTIKVSVNKYFYFLLAALLLMAVDVLITIKVIQL